MSVLERVAGAPGTVQSWSEWSVMAEGQLCPAVSCQGPRSVPREKLCTRLGFDRLEVEETWSQNTGRPCRHQLQNQTKGDMQIILKSSHGAAGSPSFRWELLVCLLYLVQLSSSVHVIKGPLWAFLAYTRGYRVECHSSYPWEYVIKEGEGDSNSYNLWHAHCVPGTVLSVVHALLSICQPVG